jgi:hypothetical protein
MVFQVIEELHDSCRVLTTFGTREMAERFIARKGKRARPKSEQKRLSIRERTVSPDSPAMNYPYLPGVGH